MFAKLFNLISSFNANLWLDDSVVFNRLTKELH